MSELTGFFAYPSSPTELTEVIKSSLFALTSSHGITDVTSWEANDIAGRFLADPILEKIETKRLLIADISVLNFNVTYEIGYAVAKRKRVFLVRNGTHRFDERKVREIGIFDTLGYETYKTSEELANLIAGISDFRPLSFDESIISKKTPVYLLLPKHKSDLEVRILSRIKKARLGFRSFDPEEEGRLPAQSAIDDVARSIGVVVPLLSSVREDSDVHNIRAAFTSGLSHGMEKKLLLLQSGDDPVPLDCRDLVSSYKHLSQIDESIAEFAPDISAGLQESIEAEPGSFLASVNIGTPSAENEMQDLWQYYLETDEFRRALRGEVNIVAGRKGSGKTALFAQLRNRIIGRNKKIVVLDLMPQGFQLLKFKEMVLDFLEEGTRVHTVTAFWEYLILLEICQKLLEKDKDRHIRDHSLYETYQKLSALYSQDDYITEGDFAERMTRLLNSIQSDFDAVKIGDNKKVRMDSAQLTSLLYRHNVSELRTFVEEYLQTKEGLWILFDNIDKGWPAKGLASEDITIVRCLIDAINKIQRAMHKRHLTCHGVVFIRNDVYELMIEDSPDRGKTQRILIDWTAPEMLREIIRRRLTYNIEEEPPFEDVWPRFCISHIKGEESSQYLIERSLMRPRALIELVQYSISHAVNLGHERIEAEDILAGEATYSNEVVTNIGFEMRDIMPTSEDILYEFIECDNKIGHSKLYEIVGNKLPEKDDQKHVIDLMLWFGVLGVVRGQDDVAYIYTVNYDMKKLLTIIDKAKKRKLWYCINPALWAALETKKDNHQ